MKCDPVSSTVFWKSDETLVLVFDRASPFISVSNIQCNSSHSIWFQHVFYKSDFICFFVLRN